MKSVFWLLIAGALLVGCTPQSSTDIAPPETWQSHLRPANLPQGFKPEIEETVYVPIYSHIYWEDYTRVIDLAATLSVRNTDATKPIILKSIRYYDTKGALVKDFLIQPMELGPMATADVVVPRLHTAGGSGANFIVEWMGAQKLSKPLIEAVMINLGSSNNTSFTSRGVVTKTSDQSSQGKSR